MKRIVECVPNFSEGRRPEVVKQIVDAIAAVEGVKMLDYSSDADHNRSVVTFVAPPETVGEAAFAGIAKAAELIDMTQQTGGHPRMGATDVCPFVPVKGVKMADCVEIAKARTPDFGPSGMGTPGAVAIGARPFLVAFNVYLTTDNVEIAQKIGKAVRHRNGGLRFVKGMGLLVDGKAQVSMNLTDFTRTPVFRVVEMIRREAARYGVGIESSELIGLIPQQALVDSAAWYLQLDDFNSDQVLENQLSEQ